MTPAIDSARSAGISYRVHEYSHDPDTASYGLEAVAKLGLAPEQVFKTLVVDAADALVVAILPVERQLSLKKIARAAGAKRAAMADPRQVERVTGYVLGGVSPLGQRRLLPTFLDLSANALPQVFISAGRRGLEIELAPPDLLRLTQGQLADLVAEG